MNDLYKNADAVDDVVVAESVRNLAHAEAAYEPELVYDDLLSHWRGVIGCVQGGPYGLQPAEVVEAVPAILSLMSRATAIVAKRSGTHPEVAREAFT